MRTIKLSVESTISHEQKVTVSTEVILEDVDDADEAGAQAMRVIAAFTAGLGET